MAVAAKGVDDLHYLSVIAGHQTWPLADVHGGRCAFKGSSCPRAIVGARCRRSPQLDVSAPIGLAFPHRRVVRAG
jgi:hypothetical protein